MNDHKEEWQNFLNSCDTRTSYKDFIYDLRYLQDNNPYARVELAKISAELEHEELVTEAQDIPPRSELGTARQLFHSAKSDGYLNAAELLHDVEEDANNRDSGWTEHDKVR